MAIKDQLEPGVMATADGFAASAAISLKRMADNSDRIMKALESLAGEMAHPEWGVAPSIREATRR